MKLIIYAFLILATCMSCNNDDDIESIEVTLTTSVSGTASDSSIIEYRDASGTIQSISLPEGDWTKKFTVTEGFDLYVKTIGTIKGSIRLNASAEGNEISFNDVKTLSSNINSVFEFEITTSL